MSYLKHRWKVLRANQCYGNLRFIPINVSFRKTVSLKKFPWIFPHPNFIKDDITFDVSNGVNVRFIISTTCSLKIASGGVPCHSELLGTLVSKGTLSLP